MKKGLTLFALLFLVIAAVTTVAALWIRGLSVTGDYDTEDVLLIEGGTSALSIIIDEIDATNFTQVGLTGNVNIAIEVSFDWTTSLEDVVYENVRFIVTIELADYLLAGLIGTPSEVLSHEVTLSLGGNGYYTFELVFEGVNIALVGGGNELSSSITARIAIDPTFESNFIVGQPPVST